MKEFSTVICVLILSNAVSRWRRESESERAKGLYGTSTDCTYAGHERSGAEEVVIDRAGRV